MVSDERGISTVADVSLALVMISAAVVMMGLFLQEEPSTHEPLTADRTAETVAGMTVSVTYNISEVTAEEPAIDWPPGKGGYARTRHGTVATLLADAAVANASYDGQRTTSTGEIFEEAIDGRFRSRIAGAETNAHVTAVWRPYENGSIEGVATAGPRPPPDEDVSSVTMTVPSGITLEEDLSTLRADGPSDRAESLARAIVEYHFPPEGTVVALESQGVRRSLTLYRYAGFLDVTVLRGSYDLTAEENGPLSRYEADPNEVNADIAADSSTSLAAQMAPEQETFSTDDGLAEWLTVEEVDIVVRTWNP